MTAHTDRTRRGSGAPGRALRREVPSTVGLLADEQDFEAMRKYSSFTFDDHRAYLDQIDALLSRLAAQGLHTTVALFDPDEFEEYCRRTRTDPDTPEGRARYTAAITANGGTAVPYEGGTVADLLPALVETAVRRATWEYASSVLNGAGICADCGQDIGGTAFDRASHLLFRLLERAGPGTHQLVCSIAVEGQHLVAVLRAEGEEPTADGFTGPALLDAGAGTEFVTVLAAGVVLESAGGVVMRTTGADHPDRLHGWHLHDGGLSPLTAAEVFNAYCTDARTGEPVAPESGVDYRAGHDLGTDLRGPHH
jgi:hypothetical protein